MKLFISYSHVDAKALERLHKHLAVLRQDGLVDTWYDRAVLAGSKIDKEIAAELESADVFIALASPDFLDSKYCIEREMARAIDREKQGTIRIIPVIVEPCDWQHSPLGEFKAVPRDGKAVSEWTNPNSAFLDVVNEIRRVVEQRQEAPQRQQRAPLSGKPTRNYRVKKDFDEVDKVEFRDASFEQICRYFEDATAEINTVEGIKARFSRTADSFNASIINKGLQRGVAHLTLHRGGGRHSMADIYFSWQENADKNSYNGSLQITNNGYELFWGLSDFTTGDDLLTAKAVAEILWNQFLERVGIS
jgi:hypothetical protein